VDINDTDEVEAALGAFAPEVVVNFAAQSMVAQSWQFPEHWYRTNVLGLVELARALERLPGLERYVHVTTPEVYGSTGGWIKESRDFRPSTPYAISRVAGDMHLFAMNEHRAFPVCFTRAANVYGPGQQLYRIVPKALLSARLGRQLRLDGGGRSTRSFIHISDVADATYAVAQAGIPGATYHISTDEIVSIRELVETVCSITGVALGDLVLEGPERPGKDDTYMLDSTHIRREMGWVPEVSLEAGLLETLAWVDANIDDLASRPDAYVHKR
jgi:dTDP-glucose 4,6-dehydratase